jgi:hypothetical protein
MSETFILLSPPTFIEGVGSLMDITGSTHIYNQSSSPTEADRKALESDVKAIGQDFRQFNIYSG